MVSFYRSTAIEIVNCSLGNRVLTPSVDRQVEVIKFDASMVLYLEPIDSTKKYFLERFVSRGV
jgi:hypothetical protein